jgi:hypothetical protein
MANTFVPDIQDKPVEKGQYYYRSPTNNGIRVIPCHGKQKMRTVLRTRIEGRATVPFARIILNVDGDTNADGTPSNAADLSRESITNLVRKIDPDLALTSDGSLRIDSGESEISLIRWEVADQAAQGLPNQQTLERLVCAAMVDAYPERAVSVQKWLDQRPFPPSPGVKEYAYSYMAGWYAENGCDDFYRCLWDDPQIVEALKARLEESGAWKIAVALAA